jgi:hypothetical protein
MTDRALLEKIREIADGRRHYDGIDDYTCYDALGDIRQLIDDHVGPPETTTADRLIREMFPNGPPP